MFHWICPECGREIAPTVRECPACDPVAATVETALAGEVEAPARAPNEAAAPALSVAPPPPETGVEAPAAAPGPAVVPCPAVAPDISPPPALAARVEPVSPLPARSSNRVAELDGSETLLPQFGAPAAGGGGQISASGAQEPRGSVKTLLAPPPQLRNSPPLK